MTPQEELKAELEKLGKNIADSQKTNDERLKKIEEKKDPALADIKEKQGKQDADFEKLTKKIESIQVAINRQGFKGDHDNDSDEVKELQKEWKEVHAKYLRKGHNGLSPEEKTKIMEIEKKALSVDSDPDGGYYVPAERSDKIKMRLFETSPMRDVADNVTISKDRFEMLYDDDEFGAGRVGERTSNGETTTGKTNLVAIPVHDYEAEPKVTHNLLEDSAFDVESWMDNKVARRFSRLENSDFIVGEGVDGAKGILKYASGTGFDQLEQVLAGGAVVTSDSIFDLEGALFEEFQANAMFSMKRSTLTVIRKLKDSQGRYLFSLDGGLTKERPLTLLGKPIILFNDMPAEAANALAIAYGDFREGYMVVDRRGIRIIRDIYTDKRFVKMNHTKRTGGGVVQFQAIKLLKLA